MKLGGTNIRQDAPGQYGHHDWNGNADDVVADEADEDEASSADEAEENEASTDEGEATSELELV